MAVFLLHCVTVLVWTTPAVTEAFVGPAAPCGRLTARRTEVSAVSEREMIDVLQRLVEELKEDKEKLDADKEWLKTELAEKNADKEDLKGDKTWLKNENKRLERELLTAKAEKNAVVNTRLVVEIAATNMFPKGTTTQATKELARMLKVNQDLENYQLCNQSKAWLAKMYGKEPDKAFERSVSIELKNLYHTLSMRHHYPDGASPESPGFYIGYEQQPTKAAAALFVLKVQYKGMFPTTIPPVFYLDDNNKLAFELRCGDIVDLAQ